MATNDFENALLRYLSQSELDRIQVIKVGIAGVGGLGSNIAHALVRTGFKHFIIADKDDVDASNLNRQFYSISDIGFSKVRMLEYHLREINPDVHITSFHTELNEGNIEELFRGCDIIFEAFDQAPLKAMVYERFIQSNKLIVLGNGMAGKTNRHQIIIKRIKDTIFTVGDGETEVGKDNPPLAPRVMTCAALMASVALDYVLTGCSDTYYA